MLGAIRVNFFLQLGGAIIAPDFLAAVHITDCAAMHLIIPVEAGINLCTVTPLVDTATLRLSLVPFQVKTVSAGQLAADQHVVVVTVSFDASNRVFNSNQVVVFIVLVMAFFS